MSAEYCCNIATCTNMHHMHQYDTTLLGTEAFHSRTRIATAQPLLIDVVNEARKNMYADDTTDEIDTVKTVYGAIRPNKETNTKSPFAGVKVDVAFDVAAYARSTFSAPTDDHVKMCCDVWKLMFDLAREDANAAASYECFVNMQRAHFDARCHEDDYSADVAKELSRDFKEIEHAVHVSKETCRDLLYEKLTEMLEHIFLRYEGIAQGRGAMWRAQLKSIFEKLLDTNYVTDAAKAVVRCLLS